MAFALLFSTAALTEACQVVEPFESTEPSIVSAKSIFTSRNAPPPIRTLDDDFALIADSVPGFGGFYYDATGSLTVVMKQPETFANQVDRLQAVLGRLRSADVKTGRQRIIDFRTARVVPGGFSYRELMRVYEGELLAVLPMVDGLITTDIDEVQNRIVIGIGNEGNVASTRKLLADRGLDPSMTDVIVEGTPRPNSLLSDALRPVPGGARIFTQIYPTEKPCTLGYNLLQYMGTFDDTVATNRYFVTASHCSSTQWALDYSQIFQGGSFAASEVGDPSYFTGGSCLAGKICRYSEGTLYKYYADTITSDDGRVAYPASIGDTSFSSYRTITSTDTPYNGMSLHMIGASSGRQFGYVTATCVSVYNISNWGNKELLCQNKASYYATFGDSGAPVITLYGDGTVSATGLNWGNVTVNNVFQYAWFSPVYQVLGEFFYNIPGYQNFSPVVY